MKEPYPPKARQTVKQAAKVLRKYFKAATDLGMHPDEFWHWLGHEIEPKRPMRPKCVSQAAAGKRRRAEIARQERQNKKVERNRHICLTIEKSLSQGEPLKSIYRRVAKIYGLQERQLRDISKPAREGFRKKSRG
jgi:hypothetical protein